MPAWYLIRKSGNFTETGAKHHIPAAAARLMRNRGIEDNGIEAFLHGGSELLHDPGLMKDMDRACNIVAEAVREGKKIRVIGDYDIDGVTSTAILLKGLQRVGADADYCIPHRIHDGYGMNEEMIRIAAADKVDLILTCDNGISAAGPAALAAKYGITLVVTDHHEVPYEEQADGSRSYILPEAAAIVDPKQEDCDYPFSEICGGMIAYKFISYLYDHRLPGNQYTAVYEDTSFRRSLFQLAAMATVGDIMPLRDENRAAVREGLKLMASEPAPGIKELIAVNGLLGGSISAFHLGFVLGPCINATGRLDSADRALSLFTARDSDEAMRIAGELKEINESRKSMTDMALKMAEDELSSPKYSKDTVLVVYLPECHESIAGIVAGRIKEKYGKPAFVVTNAEDGLKGSGRSIEAYDMYAEMVRISDIFTKFGGHAQAAGFSLMKENLEEMRRRLNENSTLTEEDLRGKLMIDMELPLSYVNSDLLDAIEIMEPFGNGNPKPLFAARGLEVKDVRVFGAKKNAASVKVMQDGRRYELTVFRQTDRLLERIKTNPVISAAYSASWNVFRGEKKIQIIIEDFA